MGKIGIDRNIIVDTCVWVSFYDLQDSQHEKSIKDLSHLTELGSNLFVTEHIVDEFLNIFIKGKRKDFMIDFTERVSEGSIKLFLSDKRLSKTKVFNMIIKLLLDQKRAKISFTDMHSIVLSYELNWGILSYDHRINNFKV